VTQENQVVARSALLPQANLAVSEAVQRENLDAFRGMRVGDFPQHSGPFWLFQSGSNGSLPLFDLAAVANNIGVITAQDELARANDNQIVALYRYNQERADLAHATGQMEALYAK
jgi:outer membrane protein TolC